MQRLGIQLEAKIEGTISDGKVVEELPALSDGMVKANFGDGVQPALPLEPPGEHGSLHPVINRKHTDFLMDNFPHTTVQMFSNYSENCPVLSRGIVQFLPNYYDFMLEFPSMCGRYGFSVKDAQEVYERFNVVNTLPDFHPRYNIAPGQLNPVILRHSPKRIERMFWGLIPHWAKDESLKYKTINARAEGIAEKPVYKKPFRLQRCLVPATGFYEWDKAHKPSTPYYFETSSLITLR